MAQKRLTAKERERLLACLADLGVSSTRSIVEEQTHLHLSDRQLNYYRKRYGPDIQELVAEGRERALLEGLSQKSERVRQLTDYAKDLRTRRRKMPLEIGKEWRATLRQIAEELEDIQPRGEDVITIRVVREDK